MNKTKILKGLYLLSLIVLGVMLVYAIRTEIEYNRLIEVSVLVGIGVVLATFGLLSIDISALESKIDKLLEIFDTKNVIGEVISLDSKIDALTEKLAWLTEEEPK